MSSRAFFAHKAPCFRACLALYGIVSIGACDSPSQPPPGDDTGQPDGSVSEPTDGGGPSGRDAGPDASLARPDGGRPGDDGGSVSAGDAGGADAGPTAPCTTRITYGSAWIRSNHPEDFDLAEGNVSWDGQCVDEGDNSYAVLSNGWKPYFVGHASCIMAFDHSAGCSDVAAQCSTRVTYGASWLAPGNHAAQYDDVPARVTWNGHCTPTGGESFATLSNGWQPHFSGADACRLSFAYNECGGLYSNAVLPSGCADPGVLREGDTYYVVCTSGNDANSFAISTSKDLVHFTPAGHVFPSGSRPAWAKSDFWAPELHHVGDRFIAYYTARDANGSLNIGAAFADSPLGPYTDLGTPLLHDASVGLIDISSFEDGSGQRYLVWKVDGNANGQKTPIYGQAVESDGVTFKGERKTLITNDLGWEGGVVEGPWVVARGGRYYLFYSGNAYYNETYAVGVARADSPLGPYTKRGDPILTTNERWIGPGHCSVVDGPSGETQMIYHAWLTGHVAGPNPRVTLVDPVQWDADWPTMPEAPSLRSVPLP